MLGWVGMERGSPSWRVGFRRRFRAPLPRQVREGCAPWPPPSRRNTFDNAIGRRSLQCRIRSPAGFNPCANCRSPRLPLGPISISGVDPTAFEDFAARGPTSRRRLLNWPSSVSSSMDWRVGHPWLMPFQRGSWRETTDAAQSSRPLQLQGSKRRNSREVPWLEAERKLLSREPSGDGFGPAATDSSSGAVKGSAAVAA